MSEDHPSREDASAPGEIAPASTARPGPPPYAVIGLAIIAFLGVLLVISLRAKKAGPSSSADAELVALQADADALRAEYNRERIAMGLSPIMGNSEPIQDIAGRLKKDADTFVALATSYQRILEEKDAEITAKSSETLRAEKLSKSLAADNSRLQGEIQRALVDASAADSLRREAADLRAQRDALSAELADTREQLRAKAKGVAAEDFADLQRRFDETLRAKEFFESRVNELESELSQASLFASSEAELLPAAVELFRKLRELEGSSDSDITSAYSSLGASIGANVLHTLPFATGSAGLTPADEEMIRNLVAEIPDGDLLLVIGYASETGNLDKNQRLSSDRATAVAELFSTVKRPGQLVQAVYLGQTDRFSSRIPERNQLCEIWRVRRK